MQLFPELSNSDEVFTPDWCAKDCVDWFKPTGTISCINKDLLKEILGRRP